MAFADFFLPKHAHSNPEVRKKAVMKLSDPKLLQSIVDNDSDTTVVENAKKRINDLKDMRGA